MTVAARLKKPETGEYAEYYNRYINLVPEGDVVATLEAQTSSFVMFLRVIPQDKGGYRYAPDKWSVKEMLGHIIDAERVFAYRTLRFARGDETPLPGFEQDDFVRAAGHDRARLSDLIDEFELMRKADILMLKHLDDAAWDRKGTASGGHLTVRAAAYILAGHIEHHWKVLREKYL